MWDWRINIWQRLLFGAASVACLLGAVKRLTDFAGYGSLVPFLWFVIFAALAITPRAPDRSE